MFPEYSSIKLFSVQPNIVDILSEMDKLVYTMILGVETMSKICITLDFQEKIHHNRSNIIENEIFEQCFGCQNPKWPYQGTTIAI